MICIKRILGILLCLALLFPASGLAAQQVSITELREQAQTAWQQTYEAHGRTITVDVLPHVPQVEAFPVLKVGMADLKLLTAPDAAVTIHLGEVPGNLVLEMHPGDPDKDRPHVRGKAFYQGLDPSVRYIPGNPLSLLEMLDLVKNLLGSASLSPGLLYTDMLDSLAQAIYINPDSSRDKDPGMVILNFYQALQGIPLVGNKHLAFLPDKRLGRRTYFSPSPEVTVLLVNQEQISCYLSNLMEEKATLAADVPLAHFDQVIKALEGEIMAGRLRQVFRLSLGYACYSESIPDKIQPPGLQDVYVALPVWAVDCLYVDSEKKNMKDYSAHEDSLKDVFNVLEYRRILINAQTGELIKPLDLSPDRERYTGFLSWDDAQ